MDFRLPPLGEGIDSATVVAVRVKPGDAVSAGQELIEVETDKASMPVTAEAAGTVDHIAVKPGDKLTVGAVVLTLSGSANGTAKPAASPPPAVSPPPPPVPAPAKEQPADAGRSPAPATPTRIEFKLPPLGEGIDGGTVVAVKVKPGDTVSAGQEFLEVETDKASMPVAVDVAGTVDEVRVKAGDKVTVGAIVAVLTSAPLSTAGRGGGGEGV
ncbi:MAG: biotin/lipoyl-containing protein [Gemmataceae bacterium]